MSYFTTIETYLRENLDSEYLFDAFTQSTFAFKKLTNENTDKNVYSIFLSFVNVNEIIKKQGFVNGIKFFRTNKNYKQSFDSYYGSNIYMLKEDKIRKNTKIRIMSIFGLVLIKDLKLDHLIKNELFFGNEYQRKQNKKHFVKYFTENPLEKIHFDNLIGQSGYVDSILTGQSNFFFENYKAFITDYLPSKPIITLEHTIDSYFSGINRVKKLELGSVILSHKLNHHYTLDKFFKMVDKKHRKAFDLEMAKTLNSVINECGKIYE